MGIGEEKIFCKAKAIAIIPARGGSKRIPRKNIKLFMGKPIIAYSIEAALRSGLFDEVMVSTDDEKIALIAREYGAKVPFFRSAETSNDYAGTADVILEVLKMYKQQGREFDTVCCIYSTAPFVTAERLQEAYGKMNSEIDSVFTCVAYSYPIQRSLHIVNGKISMVYPEYAASRSQDLEPIYHDAGQFYVARAASFIREKNFWGKNTAGLVLSELEVQDLDTLTDWALAEMKYELLHKIEE
ncbi:pseudaminic acid cytidylyltransferase [Bacteroides fluxus]|uniref:pseudaminic acid cytidylyltransferase n=1 Tax=Bacteroides fluxus TaxID=626930 RepID=UPI00235778B5|nr:pseudaminic acid cytidylyltransferase [Bacteroides fluxus]